MKSTKLFLLTAGAMICFAANSLLCRLALEQTKIDPASFTSVRIIAGAAVLYLMAKFRSRGDRNQGNWISALALFTYAGSFSLAYLTLPAGIGALLLFAAVQTTMIVWGLRNGERFDRWQATGFFLAMVGLVLLLLPGSSAPSFGGSLLMLSAGVAWGIYSLRGTRVTDPARATTGNFLRAIPFTLLLSVAGLPWTRLNRVGIQYAIISGAITSGLGYVIWYAALSRLKAMSAATVQLSVPVLTAFGGILFLREAITLRLVISSIAVLGGIALVVVEKEQSPAG